MGIKTQDFVKNLPPKEITEGVDWFGILDSFDPTILEERISKIGYGQEPAPHLVMVNVCR